MSNRRIKSKNYKQQEFDILSKITNDIEANINIKSLLRQKADFATKNRLNTLICVIKNPSLPINVCSIIRTANAIGIGNIYIIDKNNIMPKKWNEMKTDKQLMTLSASAIKCIYTKVFETTEQCVNHLKKNNFTSVVTSPHNKGENQSIELKKAIFTDKKLAIWFGNESDGISDKVIEHSDRCVKLNMYGIIESLNLATCAGIVLNEIASQRREYTTNK